MKTDWREHAGLVSEYEESLREDRRWFPFVRWLESSDAATHFVIELLDALRKACDAYRSDKGASVKTWVFNYYFRPVRTRYIEKFKKWLSGVGRPAVSLDKTVGESLRLLDDVATVAEDSMVNDTRPEPAGIIRDSRVEQSCPEVVDPPVDPRWLERHKRPLLYRKAWRQAVRSRQPSCVEQLALQRPRLASSDAQTAVLARRIWWRLMTR